MKVYPEKLKAHLSKTPAAVYIVSGDEPLLIQESCDLIRAQLKKAGFTERECYHVDSGFDWGQVLFSANSLSLFADKKLIEIRMPTGKPGDKGAKALTEFCDSPPPDTCMMLVTGRLDAATQRTKWFKNMEKKAGWVQLWPIDAKRLPGWIAQRIKVAGLTASREAVSLLCDRIEGNLLAAVQEIERLKLIADAGRVDIHHVVEDVADSSRYDVFGLIDAALSGDARRTVKMISGLKSEGVEILQLTGLIARETRSLGGIASSMRQGQSMEAVSAFQRVWQTRKPLISGTLRRLDDKTFLRVHQRLSAIDRMVKGAGSGNPWDELTSLLLNLSGSKVSLPAPRIN